MKNLNKALVATQAPFLLLILLGIAGWGFPRLIDQLGQGDPVEIRKTITTLDGQTAVLVRVTNLSKSKVYRDVQLEMYIDGGALIGSDIVVSSFGSAQPFMKPRPEFGTGGFVLPIEVLQPRSGYDIRVPVSHSPKALGVLLTSGLYRSYR